MGKHCLQSRAARSHTNSVMTPWRGSRGDLVLDLGFQLPETEVSTCGHVMMSPRRSAVPFDPLAPTIFHQPWWLNTVSGGDYQEVSVRSGGRIVGRFPYIARHIWGSFTSCEMPPLTHFLGPAIDEGRGAACNRLLRRAQITRDLLRLVPRSTGFWQKLHRGTTDVLAYQELGYTTTVQFTFEVLPAPAHILWQQMRDKTRNAIRRAEERYVVVPVTDYDALATFYIRNLAERGQTSRHDRRLITGICDAAVTRQQGRALAVTTPGGALAAAIFYVWDARSAYYLLSTRAQSASNGAVSLLLWDAMQDIAARGLIFDFDGVASAGSALFFTGFGGRVAPRYVASKYSAAHRIAAHLAYPWRRPMPETYQ